MTWITENVLWQTPGEGLAAIVDSLSDLGLQRRPPALFAHVLNPYLAPSASERQIHQRTLESLHLAAQVAPGVTHIAAVEAADIAATSQFDVVVPLSHTDDAPGPRIFDVLQCAGGPEVDGDYVVFTNMDICVVATFYRDLRQLIGLGAEALIINRRTVQGWDVATAGSALASLDLGEDHPGMDCFVFPRDWVNSLVRSDSIVGHGHVMRGLLYNLVARANPLVVLTEVGMTYHYGDDRPWLAEDAKPQFEANRREAFAVYSALSRDERSGKRLSDFTRALPKYQPKQATHVPSDS